MVSDAPFEAFSLSHGIAVCLLIALGWGLFRYVRNTSHFEHKPLRYGLGCLLIYSPISDPINTLIRFGTSSEQSWSKVYHTELPLFLCDVVAFVLGFALILRSQRLTEVGYVWAMAGTAQGLVTPVLSFDWPSLEFLSFFIQHGLGPVAALLLVWGFDLKPTQGSYRRVWIWTWIYLVTTMGLNWVLGTNYGFLNAKPEVATVLDFLGPYPFYLLSLHVIAAVFFWLLLVPFRVPARYQPEV